MNRHVLTIVLAALAVVPAAAGPFSRKKVDAARVKQLADVLRADPDEKKRKAAVAELKDADPRTHTEAVLALVATLQRDTSATIRADAADAIRQFKFLVPVAGLALEAAAEGDAAPKVRDAAKQALWEYHLLGYRSAKGTDGFAGQTAEPPLARPPAKAARTGVAVVIPVAASMRTVEAKPVGLPRLTPPPGPPPIRTVLSAAAPAVLNETPEPPLAKPEKW